MSYQQTPRYAIGCSCALKEQTLNLCSLQTQHLHRDFEINANQWHYCFHTRTPSTQSLQAEWNIYNYTCCKLAWNYRQISFYFLPISSFWVPHHRVLIILHHNNSVLCNRTIKDSSIAYSKEIKCVLVIFCNKTCWESTWSTILLIGCNLLISMHWPLI